MGHHPLVKKLQRKWIPPRRVISAILHLGVSFAPGDSQPWREVDLRVCRFLRRKYVKVLIRPNEALQFSPGEAVNGLTLRLGQLFFD
jgi:hypothetical protein